MRRQQQAREGALCVFEDDQKGSSVDVRWLIHMQATRREDGHEIRLDGHRETPRPKRSLFSFGTHHLKTNSSSGDGAKHSVTKETTTTVSAIVRDQ